MRIYLVVALAVANRLSVSGLTGRGLGACAILASGRASAIPRPKVTLFGLVAGGGKGAGDG